MVKSVEKQMGAEGNCSVEKQMAEEHSDYYDGEHEMTDEEFLFFQSHRLKSDVCAIRSLRLCLFPCQMLFLFKRKKN